jgi:hypothetical protein
MSRLTSLSPAALKAMFSPESDDTLITLLTIYSTSTPDANSIRLCDGYTKRISETARDVVYGVTNKGKDFIFLPINITLPSEEDASAPKCSITINDVTRYITPIIRTITSPPKVIMELALASTLDPTHANYAPNTNPEVSFSGFYITNFTYNAESVQAELSMINYASEPFPAYGFTPAYFPGLF